MLKEKSVFAPFFGILEAFWQAGVLGELMTAQSHMNKVIYWARGRTFCCLHYQHRSCMRSRCLRRLDTPSLWSNFSMQKASQGQLFT